jgi:hypothetical protein
MQDENNTVNEVEAATEAVDTSAATAPEINVIAEAASAEPSLPTIAGGKNVILPQSAIGKLKEEQRQRGKREAVTELEAKFKAAGFSSIDEAIAAMAAARSAPTAKASPPVKQAKQEVLEIEDEEVQATAQPQTQGGTDYAKQMQKLQRERERLSKQFAAEQAQRRKLQRTLEAKEAEFALRETAVGKGVKDVDYAVRLMQRELEGKDEKALAAFDEGKFFNTLRTTHPYLFGEMVVPATTGTGVGAAPAAPKASTVQAAQGAAGKTDARAMSADEFQKLMRARGLNAFA